MKDFDYDDQPIETWRYKSMSELELCKSGKCHDAGNYLHTNLKHYNAKRYLMELMKEDENIIVGHHTINTFKKGAYTYLIETTWWKVCGIHGPFIDDIQALIFVKRLYPLTFISDDGESDLQLTCKFYDFNEDVRTGLTNDEFIKEAKGKEIDLQKRMYNTSLRSRLIDVFVIKPLTFVQNMCSKIISSVSN